MPHPLLALLGPVFMETLSLNCHGTTVTGVHMKIGHSEMGRGCLERAHLLARSVTLPTPVCDSVIQWKLVLVSIQC